MFLTIEGRKKLATKSSHTRGNKTSPDRAGKKDGEHKKRRKDKEGELDLDSLAIISVEFDEYSTQSDSFDADTTIQGLLNEPLLSRQLDLLRKSMKKKLQLFEFVSDEIILRMYSYCEAEDMIRMGLCSKRLYALSFDRYAWQSRVEPGSQDHKKAAHELRAFYVRRYQDEKRIRRLREAANRRQEEKGFLTEVLDKGMFFLVRLYFSFNFYVLNSNLF